VAVAATLLIRIFVIVTCHIDTRWTLDMSGRNENGYDTSYVAPAEEYISAIFRSQTLKKMLEPRKDEVEKKCERRPRHSSSG
jgi:hypothetical protein